MILRSPLSLINAAAESFRPYELGWVEPERSLIMNESHDLSVAMDMHSRCGHEPFMNVTVARRKLPQPEAHGRKDISKDTLNSHVSSYVEHD